MRFELMGHVSVAPAMRRAWISLLIVLGLAAVGQAQTMSEKHLPLDGRIASDGSSVHLSWPRAEQPREGSAVVSRRHLGETGIGSWQALGPAMPARVDFLDQTMKPGVAYEYRVQRLGRDVIDVGHWATGVDVPAVERRGTALLVVDASLAEDLDPQLRRFQMDLVGDGWKVLRRDTLRGGRDDPLETLRRGLNLKEWVRSRYYDDPTETYALILIGHVPMIPSGRAAPDGHAPEPHVTDLFYAEMNGHWNGNRDGLLLHNSVPTGQIEMSVGRIDFFMLSNRDREQELSKLKTYFDKNHHWRHGLLGDLRQAYGQKGMLLGEQYGVQNLVGPRHFVQGGHHDVGEAQPWLWGVDFGHYEGSDYAAKFRNKAIFAVNFGSHKQKLNRWNNAMTALLDQPWYPLAVGWGGRPAWWPHHMALGGTIGDVHRRTVNNGVPEGSFRDSMEYTPTGQYLWRNPVWVNLLGDPTARGFVLSPPQGVVARGGENGVDVSWGASPDTDVLGYHIFRAPAPLGPYTRLNSDLVTELSFTDATPLDGARYMVRAYGKKSVHAGSFYTLSQGVFGVDMPVTLAPRQLLSQGPQVMFQLADEKDRIESVVTGPTIGNLVRAPEGWVYTAPLGHSGPVDIPIAIWNGASTLRSRLRLMIE